MTNPLRLLDRTTKGTPDRSAILANYEAEIEEVYREMESRLRARGRKDAATIQQREYELVVGKCAAALPGSTATPICMPSLPPLPDILIDLV